MSATADYIREAREQKGLTLGQVAEATSIPQYYLEILEGGGNDRLVSDRLYMVHFLRSYAAYLEIEVDTLAAQFVRENRAVEAAPAAPRKERRSWKAATTGVLFVLLMIAAGAYVYDPALFVLDGAVPQRSAEETPATEAPPEPAATPSLPVTPVTTQVPPGPGEDSVLQPEADETAPSEPTLAQTPAPEPTEAMQPADAPQNGATLSTALEQQDAPREIASAPVVEQPEALESPAEPARPETVTTSPEPAPAAEVAAAETAEAETEPATTVVASGSEPLETGGAAVASAHTLTIVADARSWLRVWVDDKPSRDFMLDPGQSTTLSADTGFNITFGNAGGVRLTFNQQELPTVGRSGQVVRNYTLPRPEQATP